jgi:hypothetical protein
VTIGRGAARSYEFAVAVVLMPVIELSLRRTTLPVTCRRVKVRLDLEGAAVPQGQPPVLPRWARSRVKTALRVTARWPAGDTCLRRCLLIGHRLRRLEPVLRIGVRRDGSRGFGAHAWLEIDGRPLDMDASEFAVLGRPVP